MDQMKISKYQEWINTNGTKIQSFQDYFADSFNISLGLISLHGKALTVWSNSSLFCHYIRKNNYERCKRERQCIIDYVLKKRKTIKYTCYMGVTYFAFPVFCDKDIVAICLGGGICLEKNKDLSANKLIQNIPIFTEPQLDDCIKLLESIFNLININEGVNFTDQKGKDDIRQEVLLLEKKLSLRELSVVNLINNGLTNKEISAELNISEKTVKTHITNILRKLKMKDRLQIIVFCKKNFVK